MLMSVLLEQTTAVLMLFVITLRDHICVLVNLDITEMDEYVKVNVFYAFASAPFQILPLVQ